jgi:hypothetical protein
VIEPGLRPTAPSVGRPLERKRIGSVLWLLAGVAAAYAALTAATGAAFAGDTPDYVNAIVMYDARRATSLWDAGHLLWNPLGWAVVRASLLGSPAVNPDLVASRAWAVLAAISWLAGLTAALATSVWVRDTFRSTLAAVAAVSVLILAHGTLNYSQTGTAYVTGLAFVCLGLACTRPVDQKSASLWRYALAGCCYAASVLLWLPFILVLPAAFVAPLLLGHPSARPSARAVTVVVGSCAAVGMAAYAAAAVAVGATSPGRFAAWLSASSHGIAGVSGIPRAVFGFARSFIHLGRDGMFVKRWLLHDPYNPTSVAELISLSLWKVALFYGLVAAIIAAIWRSRRPSGALALATLAAAPLLVFAIAWQGGDIERYVPLYPFFALVSAAAVVADSPRLIGRFAVAIFVILMATVNIGALSNAALARDRTALTPRLASLTTRLQPNSLVVVANSGDDLLVFARAAAISADKPRDWLDVVPLIQPGSIEVGQWPAYFADRVLMTWRSGGEVWLSTRALAPRPKSRWNWVEGDDRRARWTDLPAFFAGVDLDERLPDADSFVHIARSAANKAKFDALVTALPAARPSTTDQNQPPPQMAR